MHKGKDKSCGCQHDAPYGGRPRMPLTFGDGGFVSKTLTDDIDALVAEHYKGDEKLAARAKAMLKQLAFGGLTDKTSGSIDVGVDPDAGLSTAALDLGEVKSQAVAREIEKREGTLGEELKDAGRYLVGTSTAAGAGILDTAANIMGHDMDLSSQVRGMRMGELDDRELRRRERAEGVASAAGALAATVVGGIVTGNPTLISRGAEQTFTEIGEIDPENETLQTIADFGETGSQIYGQIAGFGGAEGMGGFSPDQISGGAGMLSPEQTQQFGTFMQSVSAAGGPISYKSMARGGNPDQTPFQKAFAKAVEAGKKTFTFEGKEYTTDIQTQTPGGQIGEMQTFTGTPEHFQVIQEGQGPVPLPAAEVVEDFVPRNKEEQDAYDNLGVEGALDVRRMMNRVKDERSQFAEDYILPAQMAFLVPGAMGAGPIMAGTRSTAPGILSRSYNLYPNNPRSPYGVQPMNIYEQAATNIGRYGTRDVATKPTFINRAADVVTENFPSFLRSPKTPSSPYVLPQADGGYIQMPHGGPDSEHETVQPPAGGTQFLLDYLGQFGGKEGESFGDVRDYAISRLEAKESALATEQADVERVRSEVLNQAQKIADGWANLSPESREYYNKLKNLSTRADYDYTTDSYPNKVAELKQMQKNMPAELRAILPEEGYYNVHLMSPTQMGTDRDLYCTPMGCLPYDQLLGGNMLTRAETFKYAASNPRFVQGVKEGVLPFKLIDPSERQPGDIELQVDEAPVSYSDSSLGYTNRPHHTTIYAGDVEGTPIVPGKDYYNDEGRLVGGRGSDKMYPLKTYSYQAPGGDEETFGKVKYGLENRKDYYRYVGDTPALEQALADEQAFLDQLFASEQGKQLLASQGPNIEIIKPQIPSYETPTELPLQTSSSVYDQLYPEGEPKKGLFGRQKDEGGSIDYKKGGSYQGGLRRWFKEKWVDVKTGKPCGRSDKEKSKRGYPYCRPSKRVSSKTPATSKHSAAKSRAAQKTGPKRVKPIMRKRSKK